MIKGDKCWIIENGMVVTPVEIVSFSGNLVMLKMENGKVLRLPKHRIYCTEDDAKDALKRKNPLQKKKTPYDYMI